MNNKSMNFERFKHILTKFKSISSSEPYEQTFMDLSGYPHYENVCSNILAFYFDRNEAHKMDDMLLLALCKSYDESFVDYHFDELEVEREVLTSGGKYIDIVIKDDKYVVAVENKIYQDVYNDLEDYSRHIDNLSNGREKIKIVLSLHQVNEKKLSEYGFKNILYSEYFAKLEELIGRYVLEAAAKYLNYLFDFIKTIKRLERGTVMNSEFIGFLSDNENEIDRLLIEITSVRKELRRKQQELSELIDTEKYHNVSRDFYREPSGELYDTLYFNIKLEDNFTIAIDAVLTPSGWHFDVYQRGRDTSKFEDFKKSKNIHLVPSYHAESGRIPIEYDYDKSLKEVAYSLQELIDTVST